MTASLTACFRKEGYGDEKLYFHARVIAVEGNEMLVGGGDVGLCIVDFPESVDLSKYERGNYVEIAHSGSIAESYPSQARGYALRKLPWNEVEKFRLEKTLSGVVESVTDEELRIRSGEALYMIRSSLLAEAPVLAVGDAVEVIYDGIIDGGTGVNEICFPQSIAIDENT